MKFDGRAENKSIEHLNPKRREVQWKYADGVLTVYGDGPMPNYKRGEPVPWESWKPMIRRISIEAGITKIGARAFSMCEALENVYLADTVLSIGFEAFKGCCKLKEVSAKKEFKHRYENSVKDKEQYILISMQAFQNTPWIKENFGDFYIHDDTLVEYLGEAKEVEIPSGIKEIGTMAFERRMVEKIVFPKGLKCVRSYAFLGTDIRFLTLPESIEVIERGAFSYIQTLEAVELKGESAGISKEAFLGSLDADKFLVEKKGKKKNGDKKNKNKKIVPEYLKKIGSLPNMDFNNLERVKAGNAELFILNGILCAVKGEEKNLILPEGIVKIRPEVFSKCLWLETIQLPAGLKEIGNNVFFKCENLKTVVIPESVSSIKEAAFYGCIRLKEIKLPDRIRTIYAHTFAECESLEEFHFPKNLTVIKEGAFYKCGSLKKAVFGKKIKTIGQKAFAYCSGLEKLSFPQNLEKLEYGSFRGCMSLEVVRIPSQMEELAGAAFYECGLKEVYIDTENRKKGPLVLSDKAFAGCSRLDKVVFLGDNYSYGKYTFWDTPWWENLGPFVVLRNTLITYKGADSHVVIPEEVEQIGCKAFYESNVISVKFPTGLKYIDAKAFGKCDNLQEIQLPEGLKQILFQAFCDCGRLKKVVFPKSLISIGEYAFQKCVSLEEVELPPNVEVLKNGVFAECSKLRKVVLPENLKYTSSVYYLRDRLDGGFAYSGYGAFENCISLEHIRIPAGVKKIGYRTFHKCDRLKIIYEEGFCGRVVKEGSWL